MLLHFRVSGADQKTGDKKTIRVRAASEKDALVLAKQSGISPFGIERDHTAETQEAQRAAADAQRAAAEERSRQTVVKVLEVKKHLSERIAAGQSVYIYHKEYLPVDSVLLDEPIHPEFDIAVLRRLGLAGWEVIQVIPKTIGIGLENASIGSTTGVTWGGGCGGNVAGVYVLLKKLLRTEDIRPVTDDALAKYIYENLGDFHGDRAAN